jgi:SHAQKYF class myb-like DNA-binding protein
MKKFAEVDEKSGRWSKKEHKLFLHGLKTHGRNWKMISEIIKTRTSTQVRSHAQKYFIREATKQHFAVIREPIIVRAAEGVKHSTKGNDFGTQYGEGMIFPVY